MDSNKFSGDSFLLCDIIREHYHNSDLPMCGVEVGVHRGFLSAQLLRAFPNLLLFMVDPWEDLRKSKDYESKSDGVLGNLTLEQQVVVMEQAVRDTHFAETRRAIIRARSVTAAKLIRNWLDWVFIDGCHKYHAVRDDINIWWRKIKPGGFLSGHDYGDGRNKRLFNGTPIFGIDKAVNEFVSREKLKLLRNGSCWWVKKPYPKKIPATPAPAQL